MEKLENLLTRGDGLLLVDIQNDFLPGGKMAVAEAEKIIPVLNRWVSAAEKFEIPVVASRDWHPPDHISFKEHGGAWPQHCIQGTTGAAFPADLRLPPDAIIISKGASPDKDQYSAFENLELMAELKRRNVNRLWVGGLTTDGRVKKSVLDALRNRFEVNVIANATVPYSAANGREAEQEMKRAGAFIARID